MGQYPNNNIIIVNNSIIIVNNSIIINNYFALYLSDSMNFALTS